MEDNFSQPGSLEVSRASVNSEAGIVADDEASDWGSEDDEDDTGDSFESTESSNDTEEEEQTDQQRTADREARTLERQRVLEAAGLIIMKSDRKPPPRPIRRKTSRKRRPAPAVPNHQQRLSKDLPCLPESENQEISFRLDDAYERYEAYKQSNANLNRPSLASIETTPSLPSASPSTASLGSPSNEHDSRSYSHLLHFFGRKTPANDGENRVMPIISAPILEKDLSASATTDSEFGTVGFVWVWMTTSDTLVSVQSWASLVDKSALEGIPPQERRRQEAIFELITTEAAYVRDLQLIVEVRTNALSRNHYELQHH